MKRRLLYAWMAGVAAAVLFWFALFASDVVFQSRLLPWVSPLLRVQEVGFRVASRLFPCQKEGYDVGCEGYKRLPIFIGTNAIVYASVLFLVLSAFRKRWEVR